MLHTMKIEPHENEASSLCSTCEILEKKLERSRSWNKFFKEKLINIDKLLHILSEFEHEKQKNIDLQLAYDQRSREWSQQQEQLIALLNEIQPLRERLKAAEETAIVEKKARLKHQDMEESLNLTIQQLQAKISHMHSISNPLFAENLEKKLLSSRADNKKLRKTIEFGKTEIADLRACATNNHAMIEKLQKKYFWALELAASYGEQIKEGNGLPLEWDLLQSSLQEMIEVMKSLYNTYRKEHKEEHSIQLPFIPPFLTWVKPSEGGLKDIPPEVPSDTEMEANLIENILTKKKEKKTPIRKQTKANAPKSRPKASRSSKTSGNEILEKISEAHSDSDAKVSPTKELPKIDSRKNNDSGAKKIQTEFYISDTSCSESDLEDTFKKPLLPIRIRVAKKPPMSSQPSTRRLKNSSSHGLSEDCRKSGSHGFKRGKVKDTEEVKQTEKFLMQPPSTIPRRRYRLKEATDKKLLQSIMDDLRVSPIHLVKYEDSSSSDDESVRAPVSLKRRISGFDINSEEDAESNGSQSTSKSIILPEPRRMMTRSQSRTLSGSSSDDLSSSSPKKRKTIELPLVTVKKGLPQKIDAFRGKETYCGSESLNVLRKVASTPTRRSRLKAPLDSDSDEAPEKDEPPSAPMKKSPGRKTKNRTTKVHSVSVTDSDMDCTKRISTRSSYMSSNIKKVSFLEADKADEAESKTCSRSEKNNEVNDNFPSAVGDSSDKNVIVCSGINVGDLSYDASEKVNKIGISPERSQHTDVQFPDNSLSGDNISMSESSLEILSESLGTNDDSSPDKYKAIEEKLITIFGDTDKRDQKSSLDKVTDAMEQMSESQTPPKSSDKVTDDTKIGTPFSPGEHKDDNLMIDFEDSGSSTYETSLASSSDDDEDSPTGKKKVSNTQSYADFLIPSGDTEGEKIVYGNLEDKPSTSGECERPDKPFLLSFYHERGEDDIELLDHDIPIFTEESPEDTTPIDENEEVNSYEDVSVSFICPPVETVGKLNESLMSNEEIKSAYEDLLYAKPNSKNWRFCIGRFINLIDHIPTEVPALKLHPFIRCFLSELMRMDFFEHSVHLHSMPEIVYKSLQIVRILEIHFSLPKYYVDNLINMAIHRLVLTKKLRANSLASLTCWFTSSFFLQYKQVDCSDPDHLIHWVRAYLIDLLSHHVGLAHKSILTAVNCSGKKAFIRMVKYRGPTVLESVLFWIIYYGPWVGEKSIRTALIEDVRRKLDLHIQPPPNPDGLLRSIINILSSKNQNRNLTAVAETAFLLMLHWVPVSWVSEKFFEVLRETLSQENASEQMSLEYIKQLFVNLFQKASWPKKLKERVLEQLEKFDLR